MTIGELIAELEKYPDNASVTLSVDSIVADCGHVVPQFIFRGTEKQQVVEVELIPS